MKRRALKWGAISSILAVLAVVLGTMVFRSPNVPMTIVSSSCSTGATFCIDGPAGSNQPVLYPGGPPQNLLVTFTNKMKQTIHLQSLTISLSGTAFQAGCSASDFAVTANNSTTSLASPVTVDLTSNQITVDPNGGTEITDGGSGQGSAPKIASLSLTENGNEDGCQHQALSMTYSGSAGYTLLTNTTMTATQSSGSSATLTVTVAPQDAPGTDSSFTPVGSVQFYQCASSSSCNPQTDAKVGSPQTLSSCGSGGQTACATYTDPSLNTGSYSFYAVYTPGCANGDCTADSTNHADFQGSSSLSGGATSLTITGCTTVSAANATQTIASGTTYGASIEVKSGQTLILQQGATIKGNVTVDSGGSFGAGIGGSGSPATVTGNVQSTGGTVSLTGASVQGNVQSTSGSLSVLAGTNVKGNLQQSGGTSFCVRGASGSPVQVGGNLTVQSMTTTPTTANICSATVGGNLMWQQNAAPVSIGGCGANSVLGNLMVQNNTAPVTVTGNTVTGNVMVQNNSTTSAGTSSVTSNSAGGNCLMSGNKPPIAGSSSNTTKGKNNQCVAGG
jgi:hypothetical protein